LASHQRERGRKARRLPTIRTLISTRIKRIGFNLRDKRQYTNIYNKRRINMTNEDFETAIDKMDAEEQFKLLEIMLEVFVEEAEVIIEQTRSGDNREIV